jgi:hypothetical protein
MVGVALNVVIIFLVGVAILIGLLLATYLLTVIMDRYCCCIPGWRAVGEVTEIDHGPVARKAGLWGLRQDERQVILEKILVGKPYTVDMIRTNGDEENPPIVRKNTEDTSELQDEENPIKQSVDESGEPENGDKEALQNLDEANHDVSCAICLCEYEENELIVSGTSCRHLFHKSCAFEWMSKHDHCPYCRKEMITADEMRATALELLGERRVNYMGMWGATEELMRNNVETSSAAPAVINESNTTNTSTIEMSEQPRTSLGSLSA